MSKRDSNNGNSNFNVEVVQSNQELISEKRRGRKRKVIMITGGTIVVIVAAAIIAALVILSGSSDASPVDKEGKALTLEDYIEGRLNPKSFNGSWISGNEIMYRSQNGDIRVYNADTRTHEILVPFHATPVLSRAVDFSISADRQFMLVAHDYQKIYRHSYVAQFTVINLKTLAISNINANGELILQLAVWGPVGNAIVFVARNNIFYQPSAASFSTQLTVDGHIGNVYNGVPDWVYEEEVLSTNQALWFSPDGKKLAYGKFTDTAVKIMTLPVYGEPGNLDFQYTKAVQVRYPKAGTKNPVVTLHVVDLEANSDVNLLAPSNVANQEPILAAVSWATKDTVSAIWMNRVQNEASIVMYNLGDPPTMLTVNTLKQNNGWLELFTPPKFSKDGSKFLIIHSQDQGHGAGSYRHITIYPTNNANNPGKPLTSGLFVVTEILEWDEANDLVYYQANMPNASEVQHVFTVSVNTLKTKCVTCSLREKEDSCSYNSAQFSKDLSHHVLNCEGPNVPETMIYSKNKLVDVWERNSDLRDLVRNVRTPVIEKHRFDLPGGFKAQVMLRLPSNIDKSGDTKYPMLVNVYGGPDSFQVVDRFNMDWGSYLAANKTIIYATIDGRGSGLKGDNIMFSLYRRLGTIEVEDQINVTKQIQKTLPYVDETRTAIWGWSYGGFASGMALSEDTTGVFKCGISVAPVTDWTLYDSIYTERFMGLPTPADNEKGYENAKLIEKYEGLRNKDYFLVHGTLDDNVHYQQSMLWSKVLEQNDILFRQMSYPDEDHSLGSVRPHLYHSLEQFLDECFIDNEV
uniref:Venom dipeptidyl peptidase 4 n=1 Tax=Photinus pyralis TaxID=7054 RepID=A0A1Y1KXZ8_PHOPY